MFEDNSLTQMGIDPNRCRAMAILYESMADRALEGTSSEDPRASPLMDQGLSGTLGELQAGYLYQKSAECKQLTSSRAGRLLAARAGKAYLKAGLPYGLALVSVFGGTDERMTSVDDIRGSVYQEINDFIAIFMDGSAYEATHKGREKIRHESMKRPEQIIWLLLSIVLVERPFFSEVHYPRYKEARIIIDKQGHLPVGPLGIPASAHLPLLDAFFDRKVKYRAILEVLGGALVRRSQSLTLAKRNTYLWKRVRSPVSVFDFHVFILAKAAAVNREIPEDLYRDVLSFLDKNSPIYSLVKAPLDMAFDRD